MSLTNNDARLEVHRLYNHENLPIASIASMMGIPKSTISDFVNKKTHKVFWASMEDKPIASGTLKAPEERREKLEGKRYVFTSAQNNTYVNREFLESLLVYCEHNNAQLIIGTFSYNKKGFQNLQKGDGDWYDPKIVPYVYDQPAIFADKVVWCGELNILPTAVNPLSGLDTYTKGASGIVPHTKVCLKSCPVAKHSDPKFLYTTGAVTQANYIQKKEGQKAEFHHICGALVVEVDEEGDWFARQLIADSTNSFYDLDRRYSPNGVTTERAEAIFWGDLHSEKPDPDVYCGSFGSGSSLLDTLRPKYQFCNDILDFRARNHHNIKDMHFRLKSQVYTSDKVEDDILAAANTFRMMDRDFCKTICVESNHDLALLRWLNTADPRFDNIDNVLFYHKCQVKIIQAIKERRDGGFSIFESCIREICPDLDIQFLREDESFVICEEYGGIECGSHGHLGINGGRGSPISYRRLDSKYNVGHGHTAFISEGAYGSGITGSKDQGYNKGPGTWSHSHILNYQNGKRAIITMKGEKYAAR